jgi:hypothetical protein
MRDNANGVVAKSSLPPILVTSTPLGNVNFKSKSPWGFQVRP